MTPDELYELDPEEFVAARDALARDLKKTDKAAAAEVARLRRPTVAAYGINVAARRDPEAVEALLAAGDRLRDAQAKALRGDAGALRTATEERRKAVAALGAAVAEVLGERASAQGSAVSATLEAATVDPDVAELVSAGRLDKERSAASAGFGFGDVGDWAPPPPRPKPAKKAVPETKPAAKAPEKKAKPKPDDSLKSELAAATAEAKKHATVLHDAEVRVRELKAELAEATKAVRDARTRAQRAELQVEQLRQKAWEAGERARKG